MLSLLVQVLNTFMTAYMRKEVLQDLYVLRLSNISDSDYLNILAQISADIY